MISHSTPFNSFIVANISEVLHERFDIGGWKEWQQIGSSDMDRGKVYRHVSGLTYWKISIVEYRWGTISKYRRMMLSKFLKCVTKGNPWYSLPPICESEDNDVECGSFTLAVDYHMFYGLTTLKYTFIENIHINMMDRTLGIRDFHNDSSTIKVSMPKISDIYI